MSGSASRASGASGSRSSLVDILSSLASAYSTAASPTVRIVDALLVYALFAGIVQFAYCALVGTFPFNSFLSGLLATVGVFVLTASLRLQLTDTEEFKDRSQYAAFAEYLMSCTLLFLAVLNFLG